MRFTHFSLSRSGLLMTRESRKALMMLHGQNMQPWIKGLRLNIYGAGVSPNGMSSILNCCYLTQKTN